MDPQGPSGPATLRNESRRANDGYLFIGSNKFDKTGRQINDYAIECGETPDRLRGQHCKIAYDLQRQLYTIQDLGLGLGTFLRCDNRYNKAAGFNPQASVLLEDNCVLQIGTGLYAIVNIISYR